MIVANSPEEAGHQPNTVLTVGTFDGVHRGHQAIVREVVTRARARRGRSVVVTFDPHPRAVLVQGPIALLSHIDERLDLLGRLGIDTALVLRFTYEFSRCTPREFYKRYLVEGLGLAEVVSGYDHMFGKDREAGRREIQELAAEFGFATHIVEPVLIDGEVVSSSKIREALRNGVVEQAERALGRPYSLSGIVVRGDNRGSELGFPTANIRPSSTDKLVPANGVYLVNVDTNGRSLFGMLNIGLRPTLTTGTHRVIEVHLFEFDSDLYGQSIRVHFLRRLRDEQEFGSREELVKQLTRDREECLKYVTSLQPS